MGFKEFIKKYAGDTAVYWGNITPDGEGGITGDAVEFSCRWERVSKLYRDKTGKEKMSNAVIYVAEEPSVGFFTEGWLYRGTLDDLDSNPENPKDADGAFEIQRIDIIPGLNHNEELITIYL